MEKTFFNPQNIRFFPRAAPLISTCNKSADEYIKKASDFRVLKHKRKISLEQ